MAKNSFVAEVTFKYTRVLNMPRYSYNIIIIVTNIILEFLSAGFVHLGAQQQPFYLFLARVKTGITRANKLLILFFLTTMTSELSTYMFE